MALTAHPRPTLAAPRLRLGLTATLGLLLVAGCSTAPRLEAQAGGTPPSAAQSATQTAAHPAVQRAQADVARQVQQADAPGSTNANDAADARRGLIAAPHGQVRNEAGQVLWDFDAFAFLNGPTPDTAPDTVNPSLWRQARLNNQAGLFKVRDGIWQLRGFDLSNITLIQGKTGWIVVDTGTSRETSAAAMAFAWHAG